MSFPLSYSLFTFFKCYYIIFSVLYCKEQLRNRLLYLLPFSTKLFYSLSNIISILYRYNTSYYKFSFYYTLLQIILRYFQNSLILTPVLYVLTVHAYVCRCTTCRPRVPKVWPRAPLNHTNSGTIEVIKCNIRRKNH